MKKIAALMLSLVLAMNLGMICGGAADNQSFLGGTYQNEEGKINLLCVIPGETAAKEDFEVVLGDVTVPVCSVSTVSETEVSRMVYCLVDISGSMKGRMEQAKEVLRTISRGLDDTDHLVIGKMGNQITDSGILTGQTAETEINSLEYTGEDTDLYSGLIHGLRFLQQQPGPGIMSALIVISDGGDDQGDGSTWKEAYEEVGKADIPVYTVAPILSSADYEQAKELGSFARNSAGGVHFPKSEDNSSSPISMTGEEIGEEILGLLGNVFDVEVDVSGIRGSQKDRYVVAVTFTDKEGKVYKDSMEILAKDIKLPEETEAETETESQRPEPHNPAPTSEPEPSKPFSIIPIIILIGAAAIAVLAIYQKQQKEKKREHLRIEEENKRKEKEKLEKENQQQERKRQEETLARHRAYEEVLKREQEAYNALPRLSIRLSCVGVKDKAYVIELVKGVEMTVGRNSKSKIILDSKDARLSGIHCVMFWDGKNVYVWDMQSKNGTSVNGVVINHLGKVALQPGDSLRVGNYEYRLYWEG